MKAISALVPLSVRRATFCKELSTHDRNPGDLP
jgi:hypothetical protein